MAYDGQQQQASLSDDQPAPPTSYPAAPAYVAAPPAGYPTRDEVVMQAPIETTSRGDGFWKGCCAALCCCCVLETCF